MDNRHVVQLSGKRRLNDAHDRRCALVIKHSHACRARREGQASGGQERQCPTIFLDPRHFKRALLAMRSASIYKLLHRRHRRRRVAREHACFSSFFRADLYVNTPRGLADKGVDVARHSHRHVQSACTHSKDSKLSQVSGCRFGPRVSDSFRPHEPVWERQAAIANQLERPPGARGDGIDWPQVTRRRAQAHNTCFAVLRGQDVDVPDESHPSRHLVNARSGRNRNVVHSNRSFRAIRCYPRHCERRFLHRHCALVGPHLVAAIGKRQHHAPLISLGPSVLCCWCFNAEYAPATVSLHQSHREAYSTKASRPGLGYGYIADRQHCWKNASRILVTANTQGGLKKQPARMRGHLHCLLRQTLATYKCHLNPALRILLVTRWPHSFVCYSLRFFAWHLRKQQPVWSKRVATSLHFEVAASLICLLGLLFLYNKLHLWSLRNSVIRKPQDYAARILYRHHSSRREGSIHRRRHMQHRSASTHPNNIEPIRFHTSVQETGKADCHWL